MANKDDILWFKKQFEAEILPRLAGTPFNVDTLTAIACQETGYIWSTLRKPTHNLTRAQILELCVGDTLDGKGDKGRQAFPRNKADLVAKPHGQAMFDIAREALVRMAKYIPGYTKVASLPHKFCRGFGIFQYDLQFFLHDPDFFLDKTTGYGDFGACCDRAVRELTHKLKRLGWQGKTTLTDMEMAAVAIAYNTGTYSPGKGLQQGYKNSDGRFYGECFFDYYRLARTVALPGNAPALAAATTPGTATLPPPTPVAATGPVFEVRNPGGMLNLRSGPESGDGVRNVIAWLPDGHRVRAVTGTKVKSFLEVETSLQGALLRGFASSKYLVPAPAGAGTPTDVTSPMATTTAPVPAAHLAHRPGTITRRRNPAGAYSLNEPGRPARVGTTPEALRHELAAIIDWLAVDHAGHARYRPAQGRTFCNIYAHDYCDLAGCYLPRVWWTGPALMEIAKGRPVEPKLGVSVDELRANDLFRWLRDFGPQFSWRRTGTLDKLQQEVNQGAVGIVVARRTVEGRPGHIALVVPESDDHRAKRDASGAVVAPLQSQAGATNFRYGIGKLDWWRDAQFAESAFWLHP